MIFPFHKLETILNRKNIFNILLTLFIKICRAYWRLLQLKHRHLVYSIGPCPSEVIQTRIKEYLTSHPTQAAAYLNSLLSQLNWAFSEFITMMQEVNQKYRSSTYHKTTIILL